MRRDPHDADRGPSQSEQTSPAGGHWRYRLMRGSTFLFGALFLLMAGQVLKALWVEQPRLERIIARGEQRPAQVSNLQSTPGRAGGASVDLAWTAPDGSACRSAGHPVSAEFLHAQTIGDQPGGTAVLVDTETPGCTAVIAADVAFARARTGPGPLIGPLGLAFMGTALGLMTLRFARRA